jgi:SAM-dependent methyltransferase
MLGTHSDPHDDGRGLWRASAPRGDRPVPHTVGAVNINLGCGSRWKADWENLDGGPWAKLHRLRSLQVFNSLLPATIRAYPRDLIVWDLRRLPLPFDDDSAAVVFSQYVLEYLSTDEALRVLMDCRRVLAPGGLIRLCQTDIAAMTAYYGNADDLGPTPQAVERARRFLAYAAGEHTKLAVRLLRRGGVQQLFDKPSLEWILVEAGFTEIRFRKLHEGECPDLAALETEWECPLLRVEAHIPANNGGTSP